MVFPDLIRGAFPGLGHHLSSLWDKSVCLHWSWSAAGLRSTCAWEPCAQVLCYYSMTLVRFACSKYIRLFNLFNFLTIKATYGICISFLIILIEIIISIGPRYLKLWTFISERKKKTTSIKICSFKAVFTLNSQRIVLMPRTHFWWPLPFLLPLMSTHSVSRKTHVWIVQESLEVK